jgi:hypothetical protein
MGVPQDPRRAGRPGSEGGAVDGGGPAFLAEEFFDARDTAQFKYEMVRRVTVDGEPVTATAAAFGYSRPSYYQAAAALAASGLEGLVPARPGPRRGHKLTGQILTWAQEQLAADPATGQALPAAARMPLAPLPGPAATTELVHVLAAVAVALAGT